MRPSTRAIARAWFLKSSWNIAFHVMATATVFGGAVLVHFGAPELLSVGGSPFMFGVIFVPVLGLAGGLAIRSTLERALRRPSAILLPRFHNDLIHLTITSEAAFWGILVLLLYPPWCESWNEAWLWRFPVLLTLGLTGSALSTLPIPWMSKSPFYVNLQIAYAVFLTFVYSASLARVDPSATVLWAGVCGAVFLPGSYLLWRRFLRLVRRPDSLVLRKIRVPRTVSSLLGRLGLLPDPVGRAWLQGIARRPADSPSARRKLLFSLWIAEQPCLGVSLLAMCMGVFVTYESPSLPWTADISLIVAAVLIITFGSLDWRETWLARAAQDARLPVTRKELIQAKYTLGFVQAIVCVLVPMVLGAGLAGVVVPDRAGRSLLLFHEPWRIVFTLCFSLMAGGVMAFVISPWRSRWAIALTGTPFAFALAALLIWRLWVPWPGDLFWLVPGAIGGGGLYVLAAIRDIRLLELDWPGGRGSLLADVWRVLRADILGRGNLLRASTVERLRERLNRRGRGEGD